MNYNGTIYRPRRLLSEHNWMRRSKQGLLSRLPKKRIKNALVPHVHLQEKGSMFQMRRI